MDMNDVLAKRAEVIVQVLSLDGHVASVHQQLHIGKIHLVEHAPGAGDVSDQIRFDDLQRLQRQRNAAFLRRQADFAHGVARVVPGDFQAVRPIVKAPTGTNMQQRRTDDLTKVYGADHRRD